MKRILCLLCAVCLLVTLAACGNAPENSGDSTPESSTTTTTGATGDSTTDNGTGDSTTEATSSGSESATAPTAGTAGSGNGDQPSSATRPTATKTADGSTVKTTEKTKTTTTTATTGGATTVRETKVTFDDATLVNLYGRVYWAGNKWASTPWFGWTCSGFEVIFEGTYLQTEVQVNSATAQYWNIYVDGRESYKISIHQNGKVVLAEGLSDGIHTVKVEKATERWASTGFQYLATSEGGGFLPVSPMPERKILMIGDSITAGYGTDKEYDLLTDWQTQHLHNGNKTYGAYLSQAFEAQNQILGCSTYGIKQNADEAHGPSVMRSIFLKTDYNKDASRDYDFDWVPDVVIVNLGTNDEAAGVSESAVAQAAADYIRLIRSKYPDAAVIWAYGVMGRRYLNTFRTMVQELNAEGMTDVYFQALDTQKADAVGLDGHPSPLTHKRMAQTLIPLIERITGWEANELV